MNKYLIVIGIILLFTGIFWSAITKIPFGRLPGDIVIERQNFKFYFPLGTGILLSIIISLVLYLIRKL